MKSTGPRSEAERYRELNGIKADHLKGAFYGVIQHSFALQLPRTREFRETSGWLPRRGRQAKSSASFNKRQRRHHALAAERLRTVFEDRTGTFQFKTPPELASGPPSALDDGGPAAGTYSWLLSEKQARLQPLPLPLLSEDGGGTLPSPLSWAENACGAHRQTPPWEGFIFAQRANPTWIRPSMEPIINDVLIERADRSALDEASEVSRVLFQLWAHWRSRLFGVPLASRFFNVFLPHAILAPADNEDREDHGGGVGYGPGPENAFLIQPFISLVREPDQLHCRRTFTFTVLLLPIRAGADSQFRRRTVSLRELEASVRGAWGLAADRVGTNRRRFALQGPLHDYCANVEHRLPEGPLTVRQWVEAMIYCTTAIRRDRLKPWWYRRSIPDDWELGDKVLSAIASSRMSAITVVDPELRRREVRHWHEAMEAREGSRDANVNDPELFPASMPSLVRAVSGRIYLARVPAYRVDRPFLDRDSYAEVTVPAARTLITTTTPDSQRRYEDSGLLQSVIAGYMMLGASTAQSLIRSSYHEIEAHSDPKQFGEISKEFTRDFHEIYDLDIAWESYKRTYRAILEQFEIMHDYEALRRKLEMLFDSTVAEFTEWQHTRLWFVTWLLVFGTAAIIVVTILH